MPEMSRRSHRGDALYVLFTVIFVLFIAVLALSWGLSQSRARIEHVGPRMQVHQVALAALDRTTHTIAALLDAPLVRREPRGGDSSGGRDELSVREDALALRDADLARRWARVYEYGAGTLARDGSATVVAEILDLTPNPFTGSLDVTDVIPPGLEPYRERRDKEDQILPPERPLGGWTAKLKLTATATCGSQRTVVEEVKQVKLIDLTPPAPDHTLFIHGRRTETLREGSFLLSNLALPERVLGLLHQLTVRINEVLKLPDVSSELSAVLGNVAAIDRRILEGGDLDAAATLALVQELADHTERSGGDADIKDAVDSVILSLSPRDWGRVRTNGQLDVFLPLVATDDVIGFFSPRFLMSRPNIEVGYPACNNRLSDPYLSTYTMLEGRITKRYRISERTPDGAGFVFRDAPATGYTINTRMNYVVRYPEREPVPHLERLVQHGRTHATRVFTRPVTFAGTAARPIELDGIWYATDEVKIGGPFTGRGMIVSERHITVTGDLKAASGASALLSLVSLHSEVRLARHRTRVDASIYAWDGLIGSPGSAVTLHGNLAVENLNRERMPRHFTCIFDPQLKNHLADNLTGSISGQLLSFRVLGDRPTERKPAPAGHRSPPPI